MSGGHASTRIPSGGCASGSPPRSSTRSPARTSRPATCSRSSTRPHPGGRRPGPGDDLRPGQRRAGRRVPGHPRLAKVHWQAGDRELPAPQVSVAGESVLWVDPAEIPASDDVARLGRALGAGLHGERDELMASTAAYSGLRWGELTALTIPQIHQAGRVITVDRKVVEVAGHLYVEAPKNRKRRKTIYPRRTPGGYPLADRLAARIEAARAEQESGTNPLDLIFPSPAGMYWRSSNFSRNVLKRAYLAAGWRDADGNGTWTWHSLRHVFCTTALFTWKLDPTDVSRMAGHANYRITLDMYVGTTAGVLDRARSATE